MQSRWFEHCIDPRMLWTRHWSWNRRLRFVNVDCGLARVMNSSLLCYVGKTTRKSGSIPLCRTTTSTFPLTSSTSSTSWFSIKSNDYHTKFKVHRSSTRCAEHYRLLYHSPGVKKLLPALFCFSASFAAARLVLASATSASVGMLTIMRYNML